MKWVFGRGVRLVATTLLLLSVVACADDANLSAVSNATVHSIEAITLDVYKSQSCRCCNKWIKHIEGVGLQATAHHPTNLNAIKATHQIAPRYQSCHTAVSKEGYVFEGHIPGPIIQRFLANPPPKAIGLAVPGMPLGSPGMEMGNRKDDYDVLLLTKDGNAEVYDHISAMRSVDSKAIGG